MKHLDKIPIRITKLNKYINSISSKKSHEDISKIIFKKHNSQGKATHF